jgi:hypothetical protein
MVGQAETMSDKRGMMSAECDGLRLAASVGCGDRNTPERLAVSRRPMAVSDALVYESYGLAEEDRRIVEGKRNHELPGLFSHLPAVVYGEPTDC